LELGYFSKISVDALFNIMCNSRKYPYSLQRREFPEGWKNSFSICGGGMNMFWNYTVCPQIP